MAKLTQLLMLTALLCSTAYTSVEDVHAEDRFTVQEIASDFNFPWSLAFLPDGDFLISEKSGNLVRLTADGKSRTIIENTPEVLFAGQGGLQDIVLDKDYKANQQVYLSYASGDDTGNYLKVLSARLVNDRLDNVSVIFTSNPAKSTTHHYGARMAQLADGTLLITSGDGFKYRDAAQYLDTHFGKVLRIHSNGDIPNDNPFIDSESALPEIYSYGHRNPQAILVSQSGQIWSNEHGPKGGDELNLIKPGKNYGWPAVTFGADYTGALISPYSSAPNIEDPVAYWTPSIASGGMALNEGTMYPNWQGNIFLANLAERSMRRLVMENNQVTEQEILLKDRNERIRDVRVSPDGYIYLLTDSAEGKLLRLNPTENER